MGFSYFFFVFQIFPRIIRIHYVSNIQILKKLSRATIYLLPIGVSMISRRHNGYPRTYLNPWPGDSNNTVVPNYFIKNNKKTIEINMNERNLIDKFWFIDVNKFGYNGRLEFVIFAVFRIRIFIIWSKYVSDRQINHFHCVTFELIPAWIWMKSSGHFI